MFWIITFSFILLIAITTTSSKLSNEKYNNKLKRLIRRSLIGIVIFGIVGLGGLIINHISWNNIDRMYIENVFVLSSEMLVLCWLLTAVGIVATLIYWIICPNKINAIAEKNKARIYSELINMNYNIDNMKNCPYLPGDIEIKIDSENKQIIICEYRMDTFDIIDVSEGFEFQALENCHEVKNESSGLGRAVVGGAIAGGAGAVVGVLTKKDSFKYWSVDIQLNSTNYNKAIRLITAKDGQRNLNYMNALEYANIVDSLIKEAFK